MAAAVADFRPKRAAGTKLSKEDGVPELVLESTPDILAGLGGAAMPGPGPGRVRGRDPRRVARAGKLQRKGVDLLVVNDVSAPGAGFEHDTNAVVILEADGSADGYSADLERGQWQMRYWTGPIAHYKEKRSSP